MAIAERLKEFETCGAFEVVALPETGRCGVVLGFDATPMMPRMLTT